MSVSKSRISLSGDVPEALEKIRGSVYLFTAPHIWEQFSCSCAADVSVMLKVDMRDGMIYIPRAHYLSPLAAFYSESDVL